MPPTVHILILAAGSSARMRGRDKLMEPVAGKPLLRRVAVVAVGTGQPVLVMLPDGETPRNAALARLNLAVKQVPDATQGMSRSLTLGVQTLLAKGAGPTDGVMVLPADMPGFTTAALSGMIAEFQTNPTLILRGADDAGNLGHPAIFPKDLWPDLMGVLGDEGGRSVVKHNLARVRAVALPGTMATLDLDTPEDWATFRASGG